MKEYIDSVKKLETLVRLYAKALEDSKATDRKKELLKRLQEHLSNNKDLRDSLFSPESRNTIQNRYGIMNIRM